MFDIEIFSLSKTMMGGNKALDDIGEIVFLSQFETFCDMADDHLGAIHKSHALMRVDTRLVLCEIDRLSLQVRSEGIVLLQITADNAISDLNWWIEYVYKTT